MEQDSIFTRSCQFSCLNSTGEVYKMVFIKRVRKAKLLPENNRRLRYLTKEQCMELVNSCEPHLKPIVITALNTGMRKGEILNLKWDNIDLKHGFILLDISKTAKEGSSLSMIPQKYVTGHYKAYKCTVCVP